MITCPSCKTSYLRGSTVVETGVTLVCKLKSNPRGTPPRDRPAYLVVKEIQADDSELTLVCESCGAESILPTDTYYTVSFK